MPNFLDTLNDESLVNWFKIAKSINPAWQPERKQKPNVKVHVKLEDDADELNKIMAALPASHNELRGDNEAE